MKIAPGVPGQLHLRGVGAFAEWMRVGLAFWVARLRRGVDSSSAGPSARRTLVSA